MSDEVVIRANGVYKDFKLPHEKVDSVKNFVTNFAHAISASRTYTKQHALKDVSFEIKKGEFFGIVGRNGSGKSTMLKILANIYQPTRGTVETHGKLVPFIELGVGFNPELTGRDNIYLNGALLGFSEKEIDAKYNDIVAFAELEKFMDQKLKNYSSGMQVRLAFSMAVRAEADILLVDEVLAVGDADFQRKCFDYFRQLKKEGKTVVFVSHNMDSVKEFCDRALLIEKSEIKLIGDTKEVANEYSNLFLGDGKEKDLNIMRTDKRVGTGAVRVNKVKLSKSSYNDADEFVEILVDFKAARAIDNLMTGFAVKNAVGQYINSAHTKEQDIAIPPLNKGDVVEVHWQAPNIYEDGKFTIDVYVYGSNNEIQDRIDEALTFRVRRPRKSGALVTIKPQVNLVYHNAKKRS